jgi:hypothetical protein
MGLRVRSRSSVMVSGFSPGAVCNWPGVVLCVLLGFTALVVSVLV